MAQIFLSYAREDEGKVKDIYQRLSDAGFKPWMDTKDLLPGEQWKSSIRRAVRRSDFFLACLSANSVNRRGWIQKEIRNALDTWEEMLDSDIYLIPVRLEDCEVPERLCDFQWVDLFEEDGWTQLQEAIRVGMERRKEDATVQVTLLLESDIREFTPVERESFIFALSCIVNISPGQIRVASGGTLVTLEMPEEAAQLLVSMYSARDPVLQTLHIAKVVTAPPLIPRRKKLKQLFASLLDAYGGGIALAVLALVIVGVALFIVIRRGEPAPHLLAVVRTGSEIDIDGLLTEPAWQEGDSLTYAEHPAKNGSTTATVRFLWDDDYLYVGFDVNDTQVEEADPSTPWDSDSVSVLLHDGGIAEHRQSLGEKLGDYRAIQLKPWTTPNEPADTDNGYQVEMRIKWRQPPSARRVIRADLLSVDHDDAPFTLVGTRGTKFSKLSWDGDGDITSAGARLLLVDGEHSGGE
ncbi:MAG: TIR domain-containing protein [Anaerolineales bacterium]|nr:MAG: TIR domain-containing protein [Anaerolineales bacterium]